MASVKLKHILVTGGGAPGAYGILTSLIETSLFKISSCDIHPDVIGKALADEFFTVPAGTDENYAEYLLNECISRRIDLVIPITTNELLPLSNAKEKFKSSGIEVLVSNSDALNIANSKCALYKLIKSNGLAHPEFFICSTLPEFEDAAQQLLKRHGAMTFKPCISNGSRGFRIINPNVNEHDLLFNTKPNSSYIELDKARSILSSQAFPSLLLSEYLEGEEYSVDCIVQHGTPLLIIPRKRNKINNGISVEGIIELKEELIEKTKQILKLIPLHGPIGIQYKYKNGEPYLLEINPRLQGTSIACRGAGVNIPFLAALLGLQHDISSQINKLDIKWGTHFIRHYKEIYIK